MDDAVAVERFVALARTGAWRGGTRRIRGRARGRWAETFREHLAAARALLAQGRVDAGARALAAMLDLAVLAERKALFPGRPPLARLRLDLAAEAAALWDARLRDQGLNRVIGDAVQQLIRWEPHAEGRLAAVLAERLPTADAWRLAGEATASALDRHLGARALRGVPDGASYHHVMAGRAMAHAVGGWLEQLVMRLSVYEPALATRVASHTALDGATRKRLQGLIAP